MASSWVEVRLFVGPWCKVYDDGITYDQDEYKVYDRQGVLKLVFVVSRILDTMRLVRHYGRKQAYML